MITSFTATPLGTGLYRLDWVSDQGAGTEVSLWRDGRLVTRTTETEFLVTVAAGEAPVFEVFDDPAAVPTLAYPANAILTWASVSGALEYLVQELVGGTWTDRAILVQDDRERFTWTSRRLEDDTTHHFRVLAEDATENPGTALSLSVLMVRLPDVPAASFSYDAGTQTVTISA